MQLSLAKKGTTTLTLHRAFFENAKWCEMATAPPETYRGAGLSSAERPSGLFNVIECKLTDNKLAGSKSKGAFMLALINIVELFAVERLIVRVATPQTVGRLAEVIFEVFVA